MKNGTFLLVDDDDIDAELIRRALKKLKIFNPLVRAKDGEEALRILRGYDDVRPLSRPFIMLLDINMPRMNGLELLEIIRSDPDLTNTVVFMLTTSDDRNDILRAYENHIAGYVVKSKAGRTIENALKMLDVYSNMVELPT